MCPVTWLKLLRILLALENTMFRADNNIKLLLECFNLLAPVFPTTTWSTPKICLKLEKQHPVSGMSSKTSTRLLFSGTKCFWKSNKVTSIEVLMVEHNPEQIIEIIGYHLGTQCEAPHLYVNENALTKKLDNQMSTGRHECRLKVEYLFKRFITSSGPFELEKFEIDIESDLSKFSDTEGLLISKPAGLVAYSSPFVKLGYLNSSVEAPQKPPSPQKRRKSSELEFPLGGLRGSYENFLWNTSFDSATTSSTTTATHMRKWAYFGSVYTSDVGARPIPRHINANSHSQTYAHAPTPQHSTDTSDDAYGAPPKQLYDMQGSISSPNLANAAGTSNNPRIVPKHHNSSPRASQGGNLPIPQAREQKSKQYSLSSSEEGTDTQSLDSDHDVVNYIYHTKPLMSTSTMIIGTPPNHTRMISSTQSSFHLTAVALETKRLEKKKKLYLQRRHTFAPGDRTLAQLLGGALTEDAITACDSSGGGGAPLVVKKTMLLGMRDALEGLRFPWSSGGGGGGGGAGNMSCSSHSKISPAGSTDVQDQQEEMDALPFEF